MRILVTGITGFAGGHLAELLLAGGAGPIVGASRRGVWPGHLAALASQLQLRACDLCQAQDAAALVRDARPDQVYHLAGYSNAGQSLKQPDAAWLLNLKATRNLYDAINACGGRARILHVGSGLVYGDPEVPDQAHDEHSVLRPASPYATSKAAADLLAYQYTRDPGLDIVRVRPFNHIGPAQSPDFAVAHFAQQIAAIEAGLQPPLLETGNLDSVRDLTDVRDMANAYSLLMAHGRTSEVYNAGTGKAYSMKDVLDHLLSLARVAIEVRQQSNLIRPAETHVARADPSKLERETGWRPQVRLEQSLADTLAFWRRQVGCR